MRRYIGKFNSVDLPREEPRVWQGRLLRLNKPGPRSIPRSLTGPDSKLVTRNGVPPIERGDELWICTDVFGPGLLAVSEVEKVESNSRLIEIRLGRTIPILNPIKLADFGRLQSGSRVFGQLQRSRSPDLYHVTAAEFEEFEQLILIRKGRRSLPESRPLDGTISPDTSSPEVESTSSRPNELATDIRRETYRMSMLIIERVKRGGEPGVRFNPLRSAPNLSDLDSLLSQKWVEQNGQCALCRGPLVVGGSNKMLQPSADRTDSANGAYDDANVAITHLACNLAKNKYGMDEFEDWLSILRGVDH